MEHPAVTAAQAAHEARIMADAAYALLEHEEKNTNDSLRDAIDAMKTVRDESNDSDIRKKFDERITKMKQQLEDNNEAP